jgi:hypothetical protein
MGVKEIECTVDSSGSGYIPLEHSIHFPIP